LRGIYELRLSAYGSSDIQVNLEEIPYGERLSNYGGMYDKINMSDHPEMSDIMWNARYNGKDIVVSSMTTFSSLLMHKGDKLLFTHVVHPAREGEDDIRCEIEEGMLRLFYDKKEYSCPIVHVGSAKKHQAQSHKEQSVEKTGIEKLFDLPHVIKNLISIDDRQFVCSMKGGNIALVHGGEVVWKTALEGEIHTTEYIAPAKLIAVGHGKNKLFARTFVEEHYGKCKLNEFPLYFNHGNCHIRKL
jgi:hypothetical protein